MTKAKKGPLIVRARVCPERLCLAELMGVVLVWSTQVKSDLGGSRFPNLEGSRLPNLEGARFPNLEGSRFPNREGARFPNLVGRHFEETQT